PNTVVDKAKMVAERIRKSAENKNLIENIENKKITLSAGVASTENNNVSNAIELVGLADKAVYKAKNEGRNRVVVYSHDKSKI
ncbi:GGDEF domain-containing protein, partial [candidate division KSB1 bacterium]|nr:GGDEF domain-containing protein [candidate division KSB1 bacterium]